MLECRSKDLQQLWRYPIFRQPDCEIVQTEEKLFAKIVVVRKSACVKSKETGR